MVESTLGHESHEIQEQDTTVTVASISLATPLPLLPEVADAPMSGTTGAPVQAAPELGATGIVDTMVVDSPRCDPHVKRPRLFDDDSPPSRHAALTPLSYDDTLGSATRQPLTSLSLDLGFVLRLRRLRTVGH